MLLSIRGGEYAWGVVVQSLSYTIAFSISVLLIGGSTFLCLLGCLEVLVVCSSLAFSSRSSFGFSVVLDLVLVLTISIFVLVRLFAHLYSFQWRKQLLRIFGPELIQMNGLIKTARSAVSKNRTKTKRQLVQTSTCSPAYIYTCVLRTPHGIYVYSHYSTQYIWISSGLSRCLVPTPGLTSEYLTCSVCACAYTHTYNTYTSTPCKK